MQYRLAPPGVQVEPLQPVPLSKQKAFTLKISNRGNDLAAMTFHKHVELICT